MDRMSRSIARAIPALALLASLACSGGSRPTSTRSADRRSAAEGGVRLPAAFNESYVFLRAKIADRNVLLLFDSGAGSTVLSPALVRELRLASRGRRVTFGLGTVAVQASAFEGVPVIIGGVTVEPPLVLSWEDPDLPRLGNERAVGIIGADLLAARILEVDWMDERVVAWDTSTAVRAYPGDQTLSLSIVQSLPVLSLTAHSRGHSRPFSAVVDYGSSGSLIVDGSATVLRALLADLQEVRPRRVVGVGGVVEGPEGRLDSLAFGDIVVRGALTFIDTAGMPTVALANAHGLIGTELLRRFIVVLDHAHRRAIFRPTRRIHVPFCRNLSGVCFERATLSAPPRVSFVEQRSPAGRAGLVTGDQLLTVDGVTASDLSDRELDARFDMPGVVHIVEVRRGATLRQPTTVPGRASRTPPRPPPPPVTIRWRL